MSLTIPVPEPASTTYSGACTGGYPALLSSASARPGGSAAGRTRSRYPSRPDSTSVLLAGDLHQDGDAWGGSGEESAPAADAESRRRDPGGVISARPRSRTHSWVPYPA